jgi:hypothetical protein
MDFVHSLVMKVHKVKGSECDVPPSECYGTLLTCICLPVEDINMPITLEESHLKTPPISGMFDVHQCQTIYILATEK